MARLTKEQIKFIRNHLGHKSFQRSFLYEEYIDHLSCDIEDLMSKGCSFDEAYKHVSEERPGMELTAAHRTTTLLLNHRYILAKKFLYLALTLFAISWLINLEPVSALTGILSFVVLGVVYLKISREFFLERKRNEPALFFAVFSFLGFAGTICGAVLIFLNRNLGIPTAGHGVDLTIFGWFFFSLLCLFYYLRETKQSLDSSSRKKNNWLAIISAVSLFLATVSVATFPLYRLVSDYIFYLILLILAWDVLALIFLLTARLMKNTLIVSLILGSFMIVFIHSHFRHKLPGGSPRLYHLNLTLEDKPGDGPGMIYLYHYYDQFSQYKLVVPMKKDTGNIYEAVLPSYRYKGYLVYTLRYDSADAVKVFEKANPDSILLEIPRKIKDTLPFPHYLNDKTE